MKVSSWSGSSIGELDRGGVTEPGRRLCRQLVVEFGQDAGNVVLIPDRALSVIAAACAASFSLPSSRIHDAMSSSSKSAPSVVGEGRCRKTLLSSSISGEQRVGDRLRLRIRHRYPPDFDVDIRQLDLPATRRRQVSVGDRAQVRLDARVHRVSAVAGTGGQHGRCPTRCRRAPSRTSVRRRGWHSAAGTSASAPQCR